MKRILIIEPYFGGSHKQFLEGLEKYVPAEYLLCTLPARNWQMRMQLSALWFIEKIKELPVDKRYFDSVLCSSFVDVAVLCGLLRNIDGWNTNARILTYFHENQFVYPFRYNERVRQHFAGINFHSAVASDGIAFNSEYNRDTFLNGCRKGLNATREIKLPRLMEELAEKSLILFPGLEFSAIDAIKWKTTTDIPVIVWNHRWEHDKNPEGFFLALDHLVQRGIDFRLLILGQSFAAGSDCFYDAEKKFKDKILHFGFVPSYRQYIELLSQGDLVVSTALHEFYGVAIIEAVRAGCLPILPDRLSYPELFQKKFLYSDNSFAQKLEKAVQEHCRLDRSTAWTMTDQFSWQSLQWRYAQWLQV